MCSIGGFISEQPLDGDSVYRIARGLIFYGRNRGTQSAGIYNNGRILKRAMDPAEFIETSKFLKSTFNADSNLLLTHTRQPTSGGREKEQAQPFQQNEITTVHNGYFFDIKGIKERWKLTKDSGVDSELVTDFIHAYGINMLPEFIKTTDGPSAIAARVGSDLYLFRTGNPIYYLSFQLADESYVATFASTDSILLNALRYNWLISNTFTSVAVPEGILCKLHPEGIEKLSKEPVSFDGTESEKVLWKRYIDGGVTYYSRRDNREGCKLDEAEDCTCEHGYCMRHPYGPMADGWSAE